MDTKIAEEILEDYLLNGVANEIYFADEAKALCVMIGNHATEINAQGFGQLFGSLQASYSERQTLCITKMFDPDNRKYPTRSIPAIINLIESHATLWSLPTKQNLQQKLADSGYTKQTILTMDNRQLSLAIAAEFNKSLPRPKDSDSCSLSTALRKLREARDKAIAHNEAVAKSARFYATWSETELLVNYAKDFITTISLGFLSLDMGDGHRSYEATLDARRTADELNSLLKIAKLIE